MTLHSDRHVRLTQIDGKLPNLALMDIAARHRQRGDQVHFTKSVERDMLEPEYDVVYGSAIFEFSADRVAQLRHNFPHAIIGGSWNDNDNTTVADVLGAAARVSRDYSIYPDFDGSIGYTQRGCRFRCGFCSVPGREGKARSVASISDIWRGEPYPKHLHLLDNDFFGQPRHAWESCLNEIIAGDFKVCLNQGINIRMVDDLAAQKLASLPYYDDSFTRRRLYTAWDNIGHEDRFFTGVRRLQDHGIPPSHLMVYMLIGYDPKETWERVFYRFNKMTALGIRPYPMVYQARRDKKLPLGGWNAPIGDRTLGEFQRWVIRKAYNFTPFESYDVNARGRLTTGQESLFSSEAA